MNVAYVCEKGERGGGCVSWCGGGEGVCVRREGGE